MDQQKISYLHNQLKKLQQDRIDNKLDHMKWELYVEQNEMRLAIQERFKTGHGPNVFVIFGGNRSGKTELGGGVIAEIMRDYHDKRIWAATLSDLSVKVQQRKLNDLLRKIDIEYGEYNVVRGWKNNTIISKKKSVIYFKTYEQTESAFQGDDLDIIWFDEEPPYSIYQEAVVRLADRKGIAIMTFTSLMGFTKLVNRFWQSSDSNHKTCVLTPFMNPFLSEAAKTQLYNSVDFEERQARIEGKPHIKQGLIYKSYCEDHRIDRFDYVSEVKKNPNRWQITEGIDPHERTPHHWLRFLYDNDNDILYVVEEIAAPYECMLIRDFALLIKNSRKEMGKSIKIDWCQIDTSAMKPDVINIHPDEEQTNVNTVRREFTRNKIDTILCIKDNSVGLDAVRSRLKILRNSEGKVLKKPRFYFFKDLLGTHEQISKYVWESYSSSMVTDRKEMTNKPRKKDDHFCDILKYEAIKRINKQEEDKFQYQETEIYEGIGY